MGCSPAPTYSCTTIVVVNVNVNTPGSGPPPPPPPPPPPLVPLELKKCTIDAYIADIHSLVTLSQEFNNPNTTAASGIYTFSMLASAAICGFKVIRGSGTTLNGRVKNKAQAQKEYDEAVKAGLTAAIGKEETKDIFTICVGNVAPKETLTVQLSYINTLIDHENLTIDNDVVPQLRLTVPRAYVQRYGTTSGEIDRSTKTDIPFHFTIDIQQVDQIDKIETPAGVVSPRKGSKHETITFDSNDTTIAANKDIVIIITAKGLDKPHAFIEPHPSPTRATTAIALSWVPDLSSTVYKLSPPPEMEYII